MRRWHDHNPFCVIAGLAVIPLCVRQAADQSRHVSAAARPAINRSARWQYQQYVHYHRSEQDVSFCCRAGLRRHTPQCEACTVNLDAYPSFHETFTEKKQNIDYLRKICQRCVEAAYTLRFCSFSLLRSIYPSTITSNGTGACTCKYIGTQAHTPACHVLRRQPK